jgi:hypothetical protein
MAASSVRYWFRSAGHVSWLAVCFVSLSLTSCGSKEPPVYEVRGQILFNGKPVPHAFVALHPLESTQPTAIRPSATTDETGHFILSSYHAEDGAPPGEYIATVEWRKPKQLDSDASVQGPNLLPARYSKPATSDLRVIVKPDNNEEQYLRLKK